MSRAAPLPPAQRREAILDAILPLVLEQGHDLGTRQIAEASGIAEGTIYRVFPSKADLIDAAIRRALAPEHVLDALAALPRQDTLEQLVAGIAGVLAEHARTVHRLLRLLRAPDAPGHGRVASRPRHDYGAQVLVAVEQALQPWASELQLPPARVAGALVALSFGSSLSADPLPAPTIAAILLNGVSRPQPKGCTCS